MVIPGPSAVRSVPTTTKRAHYVPVPAGNAEPFLPEAPAHGTVPLAAMREKRKQTDHIKEEGPGGISEASIDASYAAKIML